MPVIASASYYVGFLRWSLLSLYVAVNSNLQNLNIIISRKNTINFLKNMYICTYDPNDAF